MIPEEDWDSLDPKESLQTVEDPDFGARVTLSSCIIVQLRCSLRVYTTTV